MISHKNLETFFTLLEGRGQQAGRRALRDLLLEILRHETEIFIPVIFCLCKWTLTNKYPS